jgi:hypothetical protein
MFSFSKNIEFLIPSKKITLPMVLPTDNKKDYSMSVSYFIMNVKYNEETPSADGVFRSYFLIGPPYGTVNMLSIQLDQIWAVTEI